MSLVTTKQLLDVAEAHGNFAVGAFNVHNMEYTQAVVQAAEEVGAPVILMLGEPIIPYMGLDMMVAITKEAAEKASVPIAIALDHGKKKENIEKSIGHGISIMYDGSELEFEANVRETKRITELAHEKGISVEAELGALSGSEDGEEEREELLTDPELAKSFSEDTGIDILAVSIGNQHGLYKGKAKIDIKRLKQIREKVSVPLVMHGGSDLSDDVVKEIIASGITKFNIGTDLKIAFRDALKKNLNENPDIFQPHHVLEPARDAIRDEAKKKMILFNSQDKAKLYKL